MKLQTLQGETTRPTSDKVKESLFNRIGPYFDGGVVVDLFGGSGALALEALSRGAEHAYIFESDRRALTTIRQNVEKAKMSSRVTIVPSRAEKSIAYLQQREVCIDYLFLDPPYEKTEYYALIAQFVEMEIMCHNATIVCEHMSSYTLPEHYGTFQRSSEKKYGASTISIYTE